MSAADAAEWGKQDPKLPPEKARNTVYITEHSTLPGVPVSYRVGWMVLRRV